MVYVEVKQSMPNGEVTIISGEWVTPLEAMVRMQGAIAMLREQEGPKVDLSWGEQGPSLSAPSEEELKALQSTLSHH